MSKLGGRPGVLLDRDGTIIIDHGYVGSVERVEFIDGAIEAIAALNRAGLPVAVVTNQAGVARGMYVIEDVQQVHKHMIAELARGGAHVDEWLFCPYHPEGSVEAFARSSADRKPGPGMALAAAEALGLDLSASWMVGDSDADIGLARAVGARAVRVGLPAGAPAADPDVVSVPDLAAAVAHILATGADAGNTLLVPTAAFPVHAYSDAGVYGSEYRNELDVALRTIDPSAAPRGRHLAQRRARPGRHRVRLWQRRFRVHREPPPVRPRQRGGDGTDLRARVFSLSTNIELFSAIANDTGYENVFEYQLASVARPGDLLITVSSSGSSPNIVRAVEWASAHGIRTIALTGFSGGRSRELADVSIHVDSNNYGVIEDAHQVCMHLLAQYVRQSRMTV